MRVRLSLLSIASTAISGFVFGCGHEAPQAPDRPRTFPGVSIQDVIFYSSALRENMTYRVYLPQDLQSEQKLPVVYLLHGGGGSFRDWSNQSNVGQYATHGLILVMPEGRLSYWINAALDPKDRYGDYFTGDLINNVQGRFPAIADRSGRAIVGISMGGYTGVNLAFTRPELFSFVGAISPAVHVPSMPFSWRRFGQSVRLQRVFGPDGSPERLASDPLRLVKSAAPATTPYIYITAGDQDPMLAQIRRFASLLKQRGFAYEFHTKSGGHDWNEWDAQIPECFESLLAHIHARL